MSPNQIILIRHGEKVNEKGEIEQVHLSNAGNIRATEWIHYFESMSPTEIKKPGIVYAMKQKKKTSSNRCYETVKPLTNAFGLKVNKCFVRDEVDKIVKDINKQKGRAVLVCWEHDHLVEIAKKLGANVQYWGKSPKTAEDKDDFGSLWVFTKENENKTTFKIYNGFSITNTYKIEYDQDVATPVFEQDIIKPVKSSITQSLFSCFTGKTQVRQENVASPSEPPQ